MPPPGIPDWIFPGAVLQLNGRGPRYAIQTLMLTNNDFLECGVTLQLVQDGVVPRLRTTAIRFDSNLVVPIISVGMEDLTTHWVHTGEYLYPQRMVPTPLAGETPRRRSRLRQLDPQLAAIAQASDLFGDASPVETVAIVGQYYRWEHDGTSIIHVEQSDEDGILARNLRLDGYMDHIPRGAFAQAMAEGRAQRLPFTRTFDGPGLRGVPHHQPGIVLFDPLGREFFLVARDILTGTWLCRAAHDMSVYPTNALSIALPASIVMDHDMPYSGQEEPYQDLPEEQGFPEPGISYDTTMSEYRSAPGASVFMGDLSDDNGTILVLRVGDRWHYSTPNDGHWTITQIHNSSTNGQVTSTYTCRSDDGAVMTMPGEWILTNGRRISPPDPRHTGDPIEVKQLWDIPSDITRQRAHRWVVTKVSASPSGTMISLNPMGGGASIYWPEVRLRAQGRFVPEARPRRTSFERLLNDEDQD